MKKLKIFKIKFSFPKDLNCLFTVVIILSLGAILIATSYMKTQAYIKYDWAMITNQAIGFTLGMLVALVLLYVLVRKLKMKLLSLALLVLTIVAFFLIAGAVLKLLYTEVTKEVYSVSFDLTTTQYSERFFETFLIGFVSNSLIYLFLSRFHSPNLLLLVFYSQYISFLFFIDKKLNLETILLYTVTTLICIMIMLIYFIARYKIRFFKVFKKLPFSILIPIFFVVSLLLASYFYKLYEKKKNEFYEIRNAQMMEQEVDDSDDWENRSDIDFGPRKGVPPVKIVGYYKASKPLYLKTDTMQVSAYDSYLNVRKRSNSYYNWEEYISFESDEHEDWDTDEVEITYKHDSSQLLPTNGKIVGFDGIYDFSKNDNLMKCSKNSSNCDDIAKYTYSYINFDKEKYLEENKGQWKDRYDYYYNYGSDYNSYLYSLNSTYVTTNSDRYYEIRTLAYDIVEGLDNDYDKAKAIESYLRENYLYTKRPGIEDSDNPIDEFLFDTKKGYCTYFATSMSMMLEIVGVDSRVVGGYYSNLYSEEKDVYIMLSGDLHAWVEVYIHGYGWVTFDPTSARCVAGETCGRGEDYENFAGFSEEDIQDVLQKVNSGVGFDDLDKADDMKDEWEDAKDKHEKKEEEKEKKEENEKIEEIEEEKEKNIKRTMLICFGSLAALILAVLVGFTVFVVLQRLFFRDYFKDKKIKRKIRKMDRRLRAIFIRKYFLHDSIIKTSPKQILAKLQDTKAFSDDIVKFYRLINKILYSKKYTDEEFEKTKEIYRRVKSSI